MSIDIRVGDCLDVMPTLALSSVDSIVTDPPYGLGFMGKAWDRGVPGSLYWAQALRVIRPGGYLLAFGGTRTFHRLTCAIEDAGWEIHDCVSWLYGSGFPKHRSKLKPAWEPIIVARRPASTATELNIESCRIALHGDSPSGSGRRAIPVSGDTRSTAAAGMFAASDNGGNTTPLSGRWPANVVIDEQTALAIDEQTGELTSGANPTRRGSNKFANTYGDFEGQAECQPARGVDRGGASRFYYCAKASRAERDAGLSAFEKKPLHWSSGSASPGTFQSDGTDKNARNHHPTVKPIALMRWLCRLVTPQSGLVLDPFAGSGSTGCAAISEGFRFVGIELNPEYADIARARIASSLSASDGE